jgi:hypothetical protein
MRVHIYTHKHIKECGFRASWPFFFPITQLLEVLLQTNPSQLAYVRNAEFVRAGVCVCVSVVCACVCVCVCACVSVCRR